MSALNWLQRDAAFRTTEAVPYRRLRTAVLQALKRACPHDDPHVVWGEACTLGPARREAETITFQHIPYNLAAQ